MVIRTVFSSSRLGIVWSLVSVSIAMVIVVHEFCQSLVRRHQIAAREVQLPFQERPHGQKPAGVPYMGTNPRAMRNLALEERLLPRFNCCDRLFARYFHGSSADDSILITIPIWGRV